MQAEELMQMAKQAMTRAYAPYSGFFVGAALLTKDGKVYTGCNIENAAYTPTICAERTAFSKAVDDGARAFSMIAITGGKGAKVNGICAPCGVCRQVMQEFCASDFQIVLFDGTKIVSYHLQELLPLGFDGRTMDVENNGEV